MEGKRKMKYLKYLRYVIKHKWFVMIECFRMGLYWPGIVHDLSKFLPSEFISYARFFYGDTNVRDETGAYKPTDTGNSAFDFSWLLHQKRNKHHWQWWILPEDNGGIKILDIPQKYLKEMACDWCGAGKAQGFISKEKYNRFSETQKWYHKNKDKMQMTEYSRCQIEGIINYYPSTFLSEEEIIKQIKEMEVLKEPTNES